MTENISFSKDRHFDRILIIADIEGSSGCWNYRASSFLTKEWSRACLEMTEDVAAVVSALFQAGVREIIVKDFHRTAYNLLSELIDPRPYVVGKLAETFGIYPNIGHLLPAMGYGDQQIKDLEETINNTDCDSVVIATPIDLNRLIKIRKPNTRVYYDLQEIGQPDLDTILDDFLKK